MPQYRVVSRVVESAGFIKKEKVVLVIQRLGRGMSHSGLMVDQWYDCDQNDITEVVLALFSDKEK